MVKLIVELWALRCGIHAFQNGLLNEIDVARFARRAKGKAILDISASKGSALILVDPNKPVVTGSGDLEIPKVLGTVSAFPYAKGKAGAWVLHQFYADNPMNAIVLLSAAMKAFGTIIPDSSVSPAARNMIKTFYDKNKDDPNKITQNFISGDGQENMSNKSNLDSDRWEHDFLNAAYHAGDEFPLDQFISTGREMLRSYADKQGVSTSKVLVATARAMQQGWKEAYRDEKKTGRDKAGDLRVKGLSQMSQTTQGTEKSLKKPAHSVAVGDEELDIPMHSVLGKK